MKLIVNQDVLIRETLPEILPCFRGLSGKHSKGQEEGSVYRTNLWITSPVTIGILRRIAPYDRTAETNNTRQLLYNPLVASGKDAATRSNTRSERKNLLAFVCFRGQLCFPHPSPLPRWVSKICERTNQTPLPTKKENKWNMSRWYFL